MGWDGLGWLGVFAAKIIGTKSPKLTEIKYFGRLELSGRSDISAAGGGEKLDITASRTRARHFKKRKLK